MIDELEQNNVEQNNMRFFESLFGKELNEDNGFKTFDYDKFCAMVLYFATENPNLLKTKLMKLLNYADMIFYKENGISMSGTKYTHLPYGPVPDHFDIILDKMASDEIAHIEVFYDGIYENHQIVADCDIPEGALSDEEIDVLSRIDEKFKDFKSVEISDYSHKERGYSETEIGDTISYSYAKDIEID